jgi:hypothetical protein
MESLCGLSSTAQEFEQEEAEGTEMTQEESKMTTAAITQLIRSKLKDCLRSFQLLGHRWQI